MLPRKALQNKKNSLNEFIQEIIGPCKQQRLNVLLLDGFHSFYKNKS